MTNYSYGIDSLSILESNINMHRVGVGVSKGERNMPQYLKIST